MACRAIENMLQKMNVQRFCRLRPIAFEQQHENAEAGIQSLSGERLDTIKSNVVPGEQGKRVCHNHPLQAGSIPS